MNRVLLSNRCKCNNPIARAKIVNKEFLTSPYNYVNNFKIYISLPIENWEMKGGTKKYDGTK